MKQFYNLQVAVMVLLCVPGGLSAQGDSAALASSYKNYENIHEQAPVAANDYISSTNSRIVSGNVTANDHDPSGKAITAYLVTNSPDGNITLTESGNFSFVPNATFYGTRTMFSYKVCNGSLCSETATVTINYRKN